MRDVSCLRKESRCLNSDLLASTAIRRCHPTHLKRASAPTSARSAPRASIASWATSVQIAVGALFPDQSDRRRTGKATTFLARTRPVPRSSSSRSIRWPMHSSQPRLDPYRRRNDKPAIVSETANNAINMGSKKRRSFVAPLFAAGYDEC